MENSNKHHKYTCVNKQERKKKKVRYSINHKPKKFLTDSLKSIFNTLFLRGSYKYNYYKNIPLPKNCIILYNDCNHKSFRLYNKKTKKYSKHTRLYYNYY